MPRTEEELEIAAAQLVVQTKAIFQNKLHEMLIQRFGYQDAHRVLHGAACNLLATCLTNESLDCDGTVAREENPIGFDREHERRLQIGFQVAAAASEAFLRRIYADLN